MTKDAQKQPPNWLELSARELPAEDKANTRMDAICDRMTALLYRAHDLAEQIDPELADHFADRMRRAFAKGGANGV